MSRQRSCGAWAATTVATFLAMGQAPGCLANIADVKESDAATSGDAAGADAPATANDGGLTPGPDGAAPPGTFACGTTFCSLSTEYCQVKAGSVTCQTIPTCSGKVWCQCACDGGSAACTTGSSGSFVTCS
jgi:hypothetical protein